MPPAASHTAQNGRLDPFPGFSSTSRHHQRSENDKLTYISTYLLGKSHVALPHMFLLFGDAARHAGRARPTVAAMHLVRVSAQVALHSLTRCATRQPRLLSSFADLLPGPGSNSRLEQRMQTCYRDVTCFFFLAICPNLLGPAV